MNENAKKWVAALRSGKWSQTRDQLRDIAEEPCSYCCLGVACEISGLGEWCDYSDYVDEEGSSELTLTPAVKKWLGMKTADGELSLNGRPNNLARLNDTGKTFSEIADIIEANQDQLFVAEE